MAVHTALEHAAVARFLERYSLGRLTALTGIEQGIENTSYRLDTDRGRYLLTLFERRTGADALPYLVALHDHLAARSIPVSAPIRDDGGTALHRLADRPACLFAWIDGAALGPDPDHAMCRLAGSALGTLHRAAGDFAMQRDNPLGPAQWAELAETYSPRLDGLAPGLARDVAAALARIAADWPRELPHATIHADLFPDNVMADRGAIAGIIDFGFACTDIRAYDLAVMLVSWAFCDDGRRYFPDRAAALIAGYEASHRLGAEERDALPLLCLGAALRFLLTRVEDWFAEAEGDNRVVVRKDPLAFARRLRFYAAR